MLFNHGLFFWVGLLILSCLEPMICLPAAASVKYALVLIVGKCINYGNDRVVTFNSSENKETGDHIFPS